MSVTTLRPERRTVGPNMVAQACASLRAFGGHLSASQAHRLLRMWRYYPELSPAEVTQILRRFGGAS